MSRKISLVFKNIPPVFLLVFFVATISVYIAIERYVSAKKFEGKSEDLYWTVAQLQIEMERSRAELVRLKSGELDVDQANIRLAVAKSRFVDFITPSAVHGMLNSVDGFKGIAELLQKFFSEKNLPKLSRYSAQSYIDRIDEIRPLLSEFSVQSRVSEVAFRDARNKDLARNQQLVSALWFALWTGIGIIILVLLYRYHEARRDVAARQILLEKERAAHKATVSAELDRTTFLATISHEIRSPLQTMQVCVELIEFEISPASRTYATLMRLKTSMMHLLAQVRDIMDISAINNMQFRLNPEDVNIESILNEAIDAYRVQLESKGLALNVSFTELPETVRLDGNRLRQIVGNLVANAIRYTDHGEISVIACVDRVDDLSSLEIRVVDTGIGIPVEFQTRIFQPFCQGQFRRPGSSGLGLAIVKELVSLLGGEVELKSEEGRGSEFIIKLPINIQDGVCEKSNLILLVDDDENISEPFSDCLHMDGHSVIIAGSARDAYQHIKEKTFSIILLDMQLGKESGYSVAEFARKSLNNKNATIIAMTAYPEEYADSRSVWFSEKLEKPFDFNRLRTILNQYLI
ncbi:hybrid sensor histidine kinase/response regulator [Chromobacterium violaceum]|uniref:ATP-binding response regulator n=1 Tax=Chromobacterium violaceum TaxID=536 RepID=UPI0035A5B7C0